MYDLRNIPIPNRGGLWPVRRCLVYFYAEGRIMGGHNTPIRLSERNRIIDLLRKYPIIEVRKRVGLSYPTLAQYAAIAEREAQQ